MNEKTVPISKVEPWADNPRNIKKKGFERLKKQIQELGVYKRLICVQENGKYITLGGSMRLRALKDLGHKEVEISVVKAVDKATKIKYALSDNDRAGETDDQKLAELVAPYVGEINLEDFTIDRGDPVALNKMIEDFIPGGEDEQARLDKLAEKEKVKCPGCGLEFIP